MSLLSVAIFGQHRRRNGSADLVNMDGLRHRIKKASSHLGVTLYPSAIHCQPQNHCNGESSFSIAERILVWSFNHTQFQCYAVMKLILKEFVKVRCTQRHKGVLCSYFIKTFLFWMYEATNPSFWETAKLQECLTYLFIEFYTCIENGLLRHYFIPRFNLLEIKLTPDAQIELLTHFRALIDGGISMIGRCASLLGVWSNFCQRRKKEWN